MAITLHDIGAFFYSTNNSEYRDMARNSLQTTTLQNVAYAGKWANQGSTYNGIVTYGLWAFLPNSDLIGKQLKSIKIKLNVGLYCGYISGYNKIQGAISNNSTDYITSTSDITTIVNGTAVRPSHINDNGARVYYFNDGFYKKHPTNQIDTNKSIRSWSDDTGYTTSEAKNSPNELNYYVSKEGDCGWENGTVTYTRTLTLTFNDLQDITFSSNTPVLLHLWSNGTNALADTLILRPNQFEILDYELYQYTISYNAGGHGSAPNSVTTNATSINLASKRSNVSTSTTATITGNKGQNVNFGTITNGTKTITTTYKHQKWQDSNDNTLYDPGAAYTKQKNVTMTATWNATTSTSYKLPTISTTVGESTTTYTISYNANGGSNAPSQQKSTLTTTNTFSGWFSASSGGTNYGGNGATVSTGATTVYAQATSTSTQNSITLSAKGNMTRADSSTTGYTVTFNANGGSSVSPTKSTATRTITYSFNSWRQGSTNGTARNPGYTFTPSADTTFYADWSTSVKSQGAVTVPSTGTREGYNLIGFSTSSTSQATYTTTGGTYTLPSTTSTNITLYAVWQAKKFNLTINSSHVNTVVTHGTTPLVTGSRNIDYDWVLSITNTVNTGYKNLVYKINGTTWSSSSYTVKGDTVITTSAEPNTYAITFNQGTINGGTISDFPANSTKTHDTPYTLPTTRPTLTYTLSLDYNGGIQSTVSTSATVELDYWQDSNNNHYQPGDTYNTEAATTFTAKWKASTVKFILPSTTRNEYDFQYWRNTTTNSHYNIDYEYPIVKTETLRVAWKFKGVRIFDENGNDMMCQAYIYTNSTWKLCEPHIGKFNGTWDMINKIIE